MRLHTGRAHALATHFSFGFHSIRRRAVMRGRFTISAKVVLVLAALALAGCGGGTADSSASGSGAGSGSGSGSESSGTPTPAVADPTPVGTVTGAAVSADIGPDGGSLSSADGALTLTVPAGAFDQLHAVSIQPISNEAHGAKGPAYRIEPEGLHAALPMTLQFKYGDAELKGTNAEYLSIAYQDAQALWHVYNKPALDADAKTLTVQTTHFSDWSLVAALQLSPLTATLHASQTLALQLVYCKRVAEDDVLVSLLYHCEAWVPDDDQEFVYWEVNGDVGGDAQNGTVAAVASTDSINDAVYTAPAQVDSERSVAVSAEVFYDNTFTHSTILISNVTLVPYAVSCEWLRSADRIQFDVSFDPYESSASAGVATYSWQHAGHLSGTLVNQLPPTNATAYGWWVADPASVAGTVQVQEQTLEGDGKTHITWSGDNPATGLGDAASGAVLFVNYDSCTYNLTAGFWTQALETTTYDGNVSQQTVALHVGSLGFENLPIPAPSVDSGVISEDRRADAVSEIAPGQSGYAPGSQTDDLRPSGYTTAHWTLRR
jgi:hypothetical protein